MPHAVPRLLSHPTKGTSWPPSQRERGRQGRQGRLPTGGKVRRKTPAFLIAANALPIRWEGICVGFAGRQPGRPGGARLSGHRAGGTGDGGLEGWRGSRGAREALGWFTWLDRQLPASCPVGPGGSSLWSLPGTFPAHFLPFLLAAAWARASLSASEGARSEGKVGTGGPGSLAGPASHPLGRTGHSAGGRWGLPLALRWLASVRRRVLDIHGAPSNSIPASVGIV